ncbi:MAG: regulatory signaling modulator protein AmpE [Legionella sp.]|uniref:regulatory signaling modulator protein AmpE n=1 Tax=Legionella sp. TaxID=459 RepID=UPI0039E6B358
MKLLVILLCLFSERFLVHTISFQRFNWFSEYYQRIKGNADKNNFFTNPWALLALIVLPLIAITAFVYLLMHGLFYGFMGLLFSIIIFFYCLGPQNVFYPVAQSVTKDTNQLVGDYFFMVNRQLFSVVFWYIVAGPIAVVTYRLITLCRDINLVSFQANEMTDLLEWIPARLTALLYLVVGNFQRGVKLFCSSFVAKPDFNQEMLRECGLQALRANDADEVALPAAESLVEHAIIVMLAFIAMFTLISWL